MSEEWKRDRIGAALRGENPTVMRNMPGGFAVIGDVQFLPGYSVMLTDDPQVERLSDLPRPARVAFLDSAEALAEAVEQACKAADQAFRRINLEIHGNYDPFLHAHIWPRYEWEPSDHIWRPVAIYSMERWRDPANALGPQHQALRDDITRRLALLRPKPD